MSAKETKAIVHHWFRVRLTMLVAIGISFIVGVWWSSNDQATRLPSDLVTR